MKERTCHQVRFVQVGEPVVSVSVSPTPTCPVTRGRANGIRQGQDDLGPGPQGCHSPPGRDEDSKGGRESSPHLPPSEDLERGRVAVVGASTAPPPHHLLLWEQRKCWRGVQAALGSGRLLLCSGILLVDLTASACRVEGPVWLSAVS